MAEESHWFALVVKPQHEFQVAESLSFKRIETFLPTFKSRRIWSDRIKVVDAPLFSGHVFARFAYQSSRTPVLQTPGVRSLIKFGNVPATVEESEIESIRTLVASGFPLQPCPFLTVGQRVRVERGPFAGAEGVIVAQRDTWRMVVNVQILQRAVAVEFDREILSSLKSTLPQAAAAGAALGTTI